MSSAILANCPPIKRATDSTAFFIPGRQGALAVPGLRGNPKQRGAIPERRRSRRCASDRHEQAKLHEAAGIRNYAWKTNSAAKAMF